MMNFVFEDTQNYLNFKNCKDVNPSGIRRFNTSPFAMKLINKGQGLVYENLYRPDNYIISASVNHSPNDWATLEGCLVHLNRKQLADVQQRRAMVMFDQTLEGYQTSWLWQYFHDDCKRHNVNPQAIIYVTGNALAQQQYNEWAEINVIQDRITVLPHELFESDMFELATDSGLTGQFDIDYKRQHLNNIKDYNCLQKRLRAHRIWFYNMLYREDLLRHGLVSMNACDYKASYFEGKWLSQDDIVESNKMLPLLIYGKNNNEHDDSYYIRRITDQVFKDSWVSVISEASFGDADNTLFLSEKIFKPIACLHPFIIVGNKHSLQRLREMGYKTFDRFIDEGYDSLPTFERFAAIIAAIKKIVAIPNKLEWYESMQDILIHNYNVLKENSNKDSAAKCRLETVYKEYFKL
jgi:hypothetical protein